MSAKSVWLVHLQLSIGPGNVDVVMGDLTDAVAMATDPVNQNVNNIQTISSVMLEIAAILDQSPEGTLGAETIVKVGLHKISLCF